MIIAWEGKGFLVPIIFLGNVFISANIDLPEHQSNAFFSSSTLLSLWLPGLALNKKTNSFSMSEVHWGFKAPHTFFFIPFQYWGLFAPISVLVETFS